MYLACHSYCLFILSIVLNARQMWSVFRKHHVHLGIWLSKIFCSNLNSMTIRAFNIEKKKLYPISLCECGELGCVDSFVHCLNISTCCWYDFIFKKMLKSHSQPPRIRYFHVISGWTSVTQIDIIDWDVFVRFFLPLSLQAIQIKIWIQKNIRYITI